MHAIEPYHQWAHIYNSQEDELSPFYGRQYSEFEFEHTVYNYYIHPQWDEFGSHTLYLKVLYADYDQGYCIIELMGEWNDCVENDIMHLKRTVLDPMVARGLNKLILVAENVMNFYSGDTDYYEEWWEEVQGEGGWIALINLPEHSLAEFREAQLNRYLFFFSVINWRTLKPEHFCQLIDDTLLRKIG